MVMVRSPAVVAAVVEPGIVPAVVVIPGTAVVPAGVKAAIVPGIIVPRVVPAAVVPRVVVAGTPVPGVVMAVAVIIRTVPSAVVPGIGPGQGVAVGRPPGRVDDREDVDVRHGILPGQFKAGAGELGGRLYGLRAVVEKFGCPGFGHEVGDLCIFLFAEEAVRRRVRFFIVDSVLEFLGIRGRKLRRRSAGSQDGKRRKTDQKMRCFHG